MDEFERLAASFAGRDRVTVGGGRGFGAGTLQVDGRIFAMRYADGLALKLPAARVAALIDGGEGLPFDGGKGRAMREWVALTWGAGADAVAIADEALAFVGGGASRPGA